MQIYSFDYPTPYVESDLTVFPDPDFFNLDMDYWEDEDDFDEYEDEEEYDDE